ncbi:hypothetical protein PAXINDRAFT_12453 [Paxillus involutus ATCC 200175]|uniref:Uncharacterized protein n=1 Tax=Paxillus involutus ATCC 200175 TaxID=664439 RepID=A0A0C9U6T7_PAXIN|nr:hypothetical protein PAXINDRAFT_12453 [Paxillus involutus ATCC 200175]
MSPLSSPVQPQTSPATSQNEKRKPSYDRPSEPLPKATSISLRPQSSEDLNHSSRMSSSDDEDAGSGGIWHRKKRETTQPRAHHRHFEAKPTSSTPFSPLFDISPKPRVPLSSLKIPSLFKELSGMLPLIYPPAAVDGADLQSSDRLLLDVRARLSCLESDLHRRRGRYQWNFNEEARLLSDNASSVVGAGFDGRTPHHHQWVKSNRPPARVLDT